MNRMKSCAPSAATCATRSSASLRKPRWRAATISSPCARAMPIASATSAPMKPSRPLVRSQPAIVLRLPTSAAGSARGPGFAADAVMEIRPRTASSNPRMHPSLILQPLVYAVRPAWRCIPRRSCRRKRRSDWVPPSGAETPRDRRRRTGTPGRSTSRFRACAFSRRSPPSAALKNLRVCAPSGLAHRDLVAGADFLQIARITVEPPEHVAATRELGPLVGRDRRAAPRQGDRVAFGPEANRARLDDLSRVGLELRAHRGAEVHLFAPGLRARLERRRGEQRFRRGGFFQNYFKTYSGGVDAQLHPPSVALHGDLVPPVSTMPSMVLSFTWPLNSPRRPESLKVRRSPRSLTSSIGTSLPSSRRLPLTRVSCCLRESVAGCLLSAAGICAFQLPATLAGTT